MRLFDFGAPAGVSRAASDRVLTLPNVVSFARLLALPFILRDLVDGALVRALVVLALFSATDWLDGYLARRLDQVSRLGMLLDPFADRALFIVVGIGVALAQIVPWWAVIAVVARDVVMLVAAAILLAGGASPPPVTLLGKSSTFGLMVALPLFIGAAAIGAGGSDPHGPTQLLAWIVFIGSLAAYWLAAADYARTLLRDRRASR